MLERLIGIQIFYSRLLTFHDTQHKLFKTASLGETQPLLETISSEYDGNGSFSSRETDGRIIIDGGRSTGAMATKNDEVVRTNDFGAGEGSSGNGNGGYEMDATEGAQRVELAEALQEIEGKKKSWYAYLLTREFWIVLALGYVFPPAVCMVTIKYKLTRLL